jgi:hypothetical protein
MHVPGLRSPYERVGGIVFFGRMLDKIRHYDIGRLPAGYNLGTSNRTFFDARCTRFLGIEYEALVKFVLEENSDEKVLAWCFQNGRHPREEEIEVWNDFMLKRGWRDAGSAELEHAKQASGFAHRNDIQTWFEFHCADETS